MPEAVEVIDEVRVLDGDETFGGEEVGNTGLVTTDLPEDTIAAEDEEDFFEQWYGQENAFLIDEENES